MKISKIQNGILLTYGVMFLALIGWNYWLKRPTPKERIVDIITSLQRIAYTPEAIDSLYKISFNISDFRLMSSVENYFEVQDEDTIFIVSYKSKESKKLPQHKVVASEMSSGKSAILQPVRNEVIYSDSIPPQCSGFDKYDFMNDKSHTKYLLKVIIREGYIRETTKLQISGI